MLSTLASDKDDTNNGGSADDEEYDPAHPTDELEDEDKPAVTDKNTVKDTMKEPIKDDDDEYDPAHPTDDISSDDDEVKGQVKEKKVDENVEDNSEERKEKSNSKPEVSESVSDSDKSVSKSGEKSLSRENSSEDKVLVKDMFGEDSQDVDEEEEVEENTNTDEGIADHSETIVSEEEFCIEKETEEEEKEDIVSDATTKQKKSTSDLTSPKPSPTTKTPEKSAEQSGSSPTKSPSIKITESNKKSAVKPFEINRKALFEKKRLYGGEIDFSQDVDFSEGAFPDTFQLNAKKIEEVFRDTIKHKEKEKSPEKLVNESEVTVAHVEESVKETKDKSSTEKPSKEDVKIEISVPKSNIDEKSVKSETEFKPKKLKQKESLGKIKVSDKEEKENVSKKKLSDRFKRVKGKPIDSDNLDEVDPIHEMRKLDKELDFELGGADYNKKKDRDQKRNKRKVSLDNEDVHLEKGKYRRDSKEEGEIDDDVRREKRKKDKKKKKYDEGKDKDTDSDTRIVIQVSQNTENRTVWEEDERLRKKKDKEERKKDKDSKKKHRRRSRSRSNERRFRSRSRERKRSKSRERSRRRHRDRSRSKSRDRSLDKTHKRKKKEKNRSRDRERSVERGGDWTRDRSRERDWSRGREREWSRDRDWSTDRGRGRDRKRSRENSVERVDIFGRSRSPFTTREIRKEKKVLKDKSEKHIEVIDLDTYEPKRPKYDEVSSTDSEKMSTDGNDKIDKISRIEVKESRVRDASRSPFEKDEEFDDEPEETEQFQYTDRDEFLGQNKSKQQRQNLITLANNEMEQGTRSEGSKRKQPPLPKPISTPTPPLPPTGDFAQFPPPPPGPPPPGPPPGSVLIQDASPSVHIQAGGPPGSGILGEGPILIQGPPPPLEGGPPPGLIQQRPGISMNVLPPGFHRGLPPTISSQRGIMMSPIRQAIPRMQRLGTPGTPGFGWQVTTADGMPSQFGSRVLSAGQFPGPHVMNGPFDGMAGNGEGPPQFPPLSAAGGNPPPHIISLSTSTPPPSVGPIPVKVDDGPESHMMHLGPNQRGPPPRLPIPLLPPSSAMVSMPPPSSALMSMPPPGPNSSVSAILGLARMGAGGMPGADKSGMVNGGNVKPEVALNQLEKISELLNTQAKLMDVSKLVNKPGFNSSGNSGIFKVPLPPGFKVGGQKAEVGTTEVVDMDMGSPIIEEGNIELPISPQFDNLIDNPEDLLEEDFNKKMLKAKDDDSVDTKKDTKSKDKSATPSKIKELKESATKKDSPKKPREEKSRTKSSKENRHSRRHKHRSEGKDLKEKALKDAHLDLDSQDVPSSAVEMTNKEKVGFWHLQY